jgi:PAS domain S-box-containing protein
LGGYAHLHKNRVNAQPGRSDKAPIPAELVIDSIRDYAIFALDTSGHIVSWNRGAERAKGYRVEEILGRHISIFYPPEAIAQKRPQMLLKEAEREGRVEDEGWRVRKDGTRFWADVVITALRDETGTLVGFAKVTRDLTARLEADEALRSSEERFRLLVTTVRDYGIFMLDPRGYIRSWNDGAQRIKGYTASEIIGRHFSVFYPAEDVAAGKPAWELRMAMAEGSFEDEGWRVRKDGTLFWANVIITTLRNAAGELVGFAKVTRDLTERRAAQERAVADARRVAEAEAANRAKTEFLAAMSHELRTPLNAIGGYTELLEVGTAGPISNQQSEYLGRIRAAQQHLLSLINDLLNYSRIEAGQIAYEIEPIVMRQVIDQVFRLMEVQASTRNLHLSIGRCPPEAIALADRLKTEQIVLNLLSNAIKFTPSPGSVTISCGVEVDHVFISVRDTGPGIPEDKREAIFEAFVQLGRSLKHVPEGVGLGLAISRDLARAMRGDLVLSSDGATGATFTLKLPRA